MNWISIKWGDSDEHIIRVNDNLQEGFCITHGRVVSKNKRCSHFPPQNAMWSDLWRMQPMRVNQEPGPGC